MDTSQPNRALERVEAGMPILVGGDRIVPLPEEIARRFVPGDAIAAVAETGEVLHIPRVEREITRGAVDRAEAAFRHMGHVSDEQISSFFERFAAALESPEVWSAIATSNAADVASARARGRSTTRLVADDKMRTNMIEGLRGWRDAPSRRGQIVETVQHPSFRVELVGAALGMVAFVFEGRPNVLADACGVLRGGNTVVFRIGSDALGTARALMQRALEPALSSAGLPAGAASLVDSPAHAAGWALFSDPRVSLAVARGSGPAVRTLGGLARQAGVPVSLHGTGGAWIVASDSANRADFCEAVVESLRRKVCNTLNTCCIVRSRADDLIPALLESLARAGERRAQSFKLHVVEDSASALPTELFERQVQVKRAGGDVMEPQAEPVSISELGHEWEWEETPEITLALVESVNAAVELFNRYSPRFVASLISTDPTEQARFYEAVEAPFTGDGYTQWVDGQFALRKPELGLSNWQAGRLLSRGGILTGDGVYSLRTRYVRN